MGRRKVVPDTGKGIEIMKNFFTSLIKSNNDNPPQQNNGYKNFAFISHSGDKKEAMRLEKFLSSYHVPTNRFQRNQLPDSLKEIFLDVKNMKGNSVPDALRSELHDSLNLIVICSSAMKEKERNVESFSGETAYVNQEIFIFVEEKKGNDTITQEERKERFKHIYLVNVDGDYEQNYPRQFREYAAEFDVPLRNIRVIDLTKATKEHVNEYHGCVSGAYVNLIAGMLQSVDPVNPVDPDELWKCYKRYRLKKILLSVIMSVVYLIMMVFLIKSSLNNALKDKLHIVDEIEKTEFRAEKTHISLNPFMVQKSLLKALPKNLTMFQRKPFQKCAQLSSKAESLFRKYSEGNIISNVNFESTNVPLTSSFVASTSNIGFTHDGNIFVITTFDNDTTIYVYDVFGFVLDTLLMNETRLYELVDLSDELEIKNNKVYYPMSMIQQEEYRRNCNGAAFSYDKKHIVTNSKAYSSACVWGWEGDSVRIERVLKHRGEVYSAEFSRDNRYVITTSRDGFVRIWDWKIGKAIDSINTFATFANFNWDGRKVVTIGGDKTRVWDISNASAKKVVDSVEIPPYYKAVFSKDDNRLVLIAFGKGWTVWERREKPVPTFKDNNYYPVCISGLSPNGKNFTKCTLNNIRICDNKESNQYETIDINYRANSCVYSPDGKNLATASKDGLVRIYDVRTKKELKISPLRGHSGEVNYAVFSPDGKIIVSSSSDSTVRLWDVTTGKELGISPLRGHTGRVNSVVFSMDGKYIVSASSDSTVRKWSVKSGKGKTVFKFKNAVECAIPDRECIYYIVDNKVYNCIARPNNESVKTINSVSGQYSYFSEDGNHIVTTSRYFPGAGKIVQEFLPLQQLMDEAKNRIKARTENQEKYKKNKNKDK